MTMKEKKARFEAARPQQENVLLTFTGVDGYDVYNCSIPFTWEGREYIFGRVERREEWARSWVRLFEKSGKDTYALVPGSMIYQLEDPFIQMIHGELVLGGTSVEKESGNVKTYRGYFYRGKKLDDLVYFTTGPDRMKDIRLVELRDGRIGVFSRARGRKIEEMYGAGAVVGFAVIDDLNQLTAEVVENAPVIGNLFGRGEWGGCNQCYLLNDGRVGVIGHKCYEEARAEQGTQLIYMNVSFIFDPETHQATEPQILATRGSYPVAAAKKPKLLDCAFTSGIVLRADGKVDLYSGVGDTHEGRVVIDNPFAGLM